ncbi:MAG: glycosyltransferase family 4 protein [Actinomycetota bacterium]
MRAFIDTRPAVARVRTGVGNYTRQLVRLLPVVDPETTYVGWPRSVLRVMGSSGGPDRAGWTETGRAGLKARAKRAVVRHELPRVEWIARFDVLLAPNFVPPPTRRPFAVTVHDLAFRLFPDSASAGTREYLSRVGGALRRASRVVVPSERTRQDLLDAYPVSADRVETVPLGVDTDVFRPAPEEAVRAIRDRHGIDGPYLLFLGGIERRKNLPSMLRAYASLGEVVRPWLVVAGPAPHWHPEGSALLRTALDDLTPEVRRLVVLTGWVPERDSVALLTGAEALVYVSSYEGFGLPVLEAMACETPVLTSAVSALPETAGDAALLVDPGDVEAIAHGMERILTDSALREALLAAGTARAAGFRWEETARRTARILHEAHGTKG